MEGRVEPEILCSNYLAFETTLGYFDLEQKTLQPLDNPFGTRLSPMS
jgi:hypothetical protein